MWRHYLYGMKCVVFTDHKSLQHILDQKELNMRQHRWLELLSDYDYELRYHPGKENVVADELSRKSRPKSLRGPEYTLEHEVKRLKQSRISIVKSESYVHFVHPLEDAQQYSNLIVSLTLSAASNKTTRTQDFPRYDNATDADIILKLYLRSLSSGHRSLDMYDANYGPKLPW
ncbi:putative reverse transcriptase domain-containing protein [Tanacetum coccineum]|uniref:Reverse transcriptase domain-containing protein n=1 Tax=Tanacetum coccineum TaxID=301880 RepID=A0ABQ4WCG9_9ASTR